jgi:hypothetical protein
MSPLAWRTPQDQSRGPRAYSPDEPREFLMGCATDPWRAAETWIRCLSSHGVPLHAATGLSAHPEVAHLPEEPSICDRCDRFRRSRLAIRRRPRMDHASWPARHQGAGWHPLQAYRAIVDFAPVVATSLFQSCRSALRPKALRARLLRGPHLKPASIGLGQSTTFTVSLKGITAARHSRIAHDHPRSRAEPSGPQFFYGDCTVRLPRTIRKHRKSLLQKVKILKACCYLAIPPRFGHRGRGYEEPQVKPNRVTAERRQEARCALRSSAVTRGGNG